MSAAFEKSVFDGNTSLIKRGREYDKHRYVDIGRKMICCYLTNYNIYKFISNRGNNLTPYSVAIDDGNIYFFTSHFKFNKREKIDDDELLKTKKKILLIHLILVFQVLENTHLENYE